MFKSKYCDTQELYIPTMAWNGWRNILSLIILLTAKSHAQLDVCGRPKLITKIVGGGGAQEGSWPWQASLQSFGIHACGGSLINKEWVMSAAHCFSSPSTTGIEISLGRQNLQGNNSNEVTKSVDRIILHPGFDIFSLENDIALLRLSSPVTFTDYIRPVCLASSSSVFNNGTESWVTGWGTVKKQVSLIAPNTLQELKVPVVGNRQCNCLDGVGLVTENMICAGFLQAGKEACQGDSGGPMVSKQDSIWIQSGIVSYGLDCDQPNQPSIYTRVSRYQSWINTHITSDKPGFVQFNSTGLDADSNYSCAGLPPPVTERPVEDPLPSFTSAELCGIPSKKHKIVGGDVASEGSWPWQASLQQFGIHICGGTLINREWILSAAHCFTSTNTFGWSVSLGLQKLEGNEPHEVTSAVATIILHPFYNSFRFENDISLVKLATAVMFTAYVRPVCLASESSVFNNGTNSWVTGWGAIEEGVPLPSPKALQEVEVPVLGNRQCNCLIGVGLVSENMICAGLQEGGKDACQGDSGGPMVSEQDSIWIQSGIVSFGFGCARPNLPGVYTRVSVYESWINSHIISDKPGFMLFKPIGTDGDSHYTCPGLPSPVTERPAITEDPMSSISTTVCGKPTLKTKIVGGEDAEAGSWPWQASLQNFGSHVCGGSLINREWVLSAAQCFLSTSTFGWLVFLGLQSLKGNNSNNVSRNVETIILHPGFSIFTFENDIALVKLSSPVTFTDYIRPVCLASSNSEFNNGTHSWVTGWGTVQEDVSLPFPETLQEVQVPVLGNQQCNCLNGLGLITENMICAGFLEGGKDTCQGDSGGPMVTEQGSIWIQSGIISFGFGCAQPNRPGVYSRVSQYQSWIDSHIISDKPGFVQFNSSGLDADSNYTCPGLPPPVTEGPATTENPMPIISSAVCGISPLNTKIVGGGDAQEGSWPWQASLQIFGSHVCAGSLINTEWVLSAAHCFSSPDIFGWSVSLGLQNLQGNNSNEVSRNVDTIILHPGFSIFTFDNDIALVRLSLPVKFTNYIRPVCLASSNSVFNNGTPSWVTGWGTVQENVPLPFPKTLQEVKLPVLGNRQCNCLNGLGTITDKMICAGFLEGGKDTCQGDSGGPMVSEQDSKWIQSGIISFGFGCAQPNRPGVYSRVSQYQSWIDSHISSDKPGFVQFNSSGLDADSNYTCPGLLPPVTEVPSTTDGQVPIPSSTVCGRPNFNTKIVGGEDAQEGSWPWQASLQISGKHVCGGSLINREWVMSAAQCFPSTSTFDWSVSLGLQNLQGNNSNGVTRNVNTIILHPGFSIFSLENDIALVRLSSPVRFTDYIRPVCLASSTSMFNNGTHSWVTGWGTIQEDVSLTFPETLQEVMVPVLGNRQCNCLIGVGSVTDNMICAGVREGGKDACQGDSGGPMVSEQGSIWIQSGIVSFGFGCARPNQPGVYSRVSRFQSWIESHISSDKPGFVQFNSSGPDADSNYTCPLPLPVTERPATTEDPVPSVSSAEFCGMATLNTKIVRGVNASEGSWPWQASLQTFGSHVCGGSLINNEWVMSAAQCFSSTSTFGWSVSLGLQNLQGNNSNQVSRNVESIIVHPEYNSSSNDNDIALLRLSSAVSFTDYIRPVCLAANSSVFNNGTESWVTGWGTQHEGVTLPFPEKLQEVDIRVVGNRQCSCLNGEGLVTDNMICARVQEGGKGLCQGDKGGPMVSKLNSKWIQSGIVSFGFGCAFPNKPWVYARVSRYQSWINSQISSDKPGFVQFNSNALDADSNYTCPLPLPGIDVTTTEGTALSSTTTSSTLQIPTAQVCGIAPLNNRVEGGRGFVLGGTWPWIISLHVNGQYACAGTLITSSFILTSAECFSSSAPVASNWTVYLGQKIVNGVEQFEITLGIDSITISQLEGSNVAVLHLERDVGVSIYRQPVCLDLNNAIAFPVGSRCWTAGWGNQNANQSIMKSERLRDLETEVVSCGSSVSDQENICTSSLDLQQGDVGGPLICKSESSWFQAAVVSKDTTILRNNIQVFSKTSRFASFLKETVGELPSAAATSSAGALGSFRASLLSLVVALTFTYLFIMEKHEVFHCCPCA